MDIEIYIDQIEKYAAGEMAADESAAFEKELASNEGLRQAYRLYRLSGEVVEVSVEDDLRNTLKNWSEADQSGQKMAGGAKVISMNRRLYALAAAASVLLLVGFFSWNFARQNYSNAALAEAFHEAPQASAFRGNGATEVLDFEKGLSAFEQKNYAGAIKILEAVPSDNSRYYEAQLFIGNSYFELKNYGEAEAVFQKLIASGDVRFLEKSEWALLLSRLAERGPEDSEFLDLFDKIRNDEGHSFHSDAAALEQQLNSFWKKIAG